MCMIIVVASSCVKFENFTYTDTDTQCHTHTHTTFIVTDNIRAHWLLQWTLEVTAHIPNSSV